jgi:hypothetical protein
MTKIKATSLSDLIRMALEACEPFGGLGVPILAFAPHQCAPSGLCNNAATNNASHAVLEAGEYKCWLIPRYRFAIG